jgi:hypothetical protein
MSIMAENLPALPSTPGAAQSPGTAGVASPAGGSGAAVPAALVHHAPHGAVLSDAAMARGRLLESWMGDPNSPYWRGDAHRSAAEYQADYKALLRGQLAGEDHAIFVEPDSIDVDFPREVTSYDLDPLRAHVTTAEARDVLDSALKVMHAAGIGQAKMLVAARWGFTHPEGPPSRAEWRKFASSQGFTSQQIRALADWFDKETARRI